MDQIEQNEGIKITFKDFISKYLKYLPLFFISAIIALIVASIYLRYATPIYNAKATILIKSEKNPYGGGSNEDFESIFLFKGGSNVENEIEILKSKNIAERVSNSLNLRLMYYAVGNVKTSLVYPNTPIELQIIKLYDSLSGSSIKIKLIDEKQFLVGESKAPLRIDEPFKTSSGEFILRVNDNSFQTLQYKEYLININSAEEATNVVLNGLRVNPIKDRSNVLLLTYQGVHPELAVDILNKLMSEYKNASIEDKNQIAIQTNNFINKRLDIIAVELGDVEKNLQTFKQRNQVVNPNAQAEIFLNNQSDIEKQLSEKEIQLSIIKYLQEYVSGDDTKFSIVPSSLGVEDPMFIQLVSSYNELQLKRTSELKTTTPNNPIILALETQIDKLRDDMIESLRNLYSSAQLVRNQALKKIESFSANISAIPAKEKSLLDITRQQGIKQGLYLFLLQKREETAISLASTISNSQVLDVAAGSKTPVKPSPTSIKGVAIFLGLIIPAIFIYLREILNDKINGRQDINKYTQAPIFGEIGHSEDSQALVMKKNSRNVISEQFRMVRTNLQYLVGKLEKPVIVITSTFSGEGKSFVSINIGAVMALAGKKTVILEFDIRKPKIVSGLNIQRSLGITNYIVGGQTLSSLPIQVPEIENLFVIPCGAIPPNPAELLLDERIKDVFEFAKREFDVVIVDTAPVGLVSDAQVLSKYADCTFYIVRFNYTLKKHIQFINEIYIKQKLPKLSLLVNDIKASSDYYSYGNYNGYGYGYNYFDDDSIYSKNSFIRFFQKMNKRFWRLFNK